jgi:peptidyl-prolyl cis-trans isomerase C
MGRHPSLVCLSRNARNGYRESVDVLANWAMKDATSPRPRSAGGVRAFFIALACLAAGCSGKGDKPSGGPSSPAPASPGAPPEIDRVTPLPSPVPDVVATVNGEPVPLRNIVQLARKYLEKSEDRAKDRPYALRRAAQEFIDRELLFQEARARKLQPDDRRVEQAYNDARLRYRDEERWADWLKDQGYDQNTFRTELRVQETIRLVVDQEMGKVRDISDEDAEAFYAAHPGAFGVGERLRVAHILCRLSDDSTEKVKTAARVKAAALLFRLKRGEDFGALARQFSDDQTSKEDGGELPEFVRGQTPRAFEDAAFALQKPGDLSDAIGAPDGLHIIKLIDRKPAQDLTFEDIKGPLKERLFAQRRQEAVQALLSRLRAKARIETFI